MVIIMNFIESEKMARRSDERGRKLFRDYCDRLISMLESQMGERDFFATELIRKSRL